MTTGTTDAPAAARTPTALRERMLLAAAELTCANGWAKVTMGKLAAQVGVSRQTVYNELGSKAELAEAVMLRETDAFTLVVVKELAHHPGDPVAGVTAAFRCTLEAANTNPLLRTVLSGPFGGPDSLLPQLTVRSRSLLDQAVATVAPLLSQAYPALSLTADEWSVTVEVLVRLLLSHLVQPTLPIPQAAERMGWVVRRLLGD